MPPHAAIPYHFCISFPHCCHAVQILNTSPTPNGVTIPKSLLKTIQIFKSYFMNYKTNTRHVCTRFNAFLMVIPNIELKFNIFEFFKKFCDIFSRRLILYTPEMC